MDTSFVATQHSWTNVPTSCWIFVSKRFFKHRLLVQASGFHSTHCQNRWQQYLPNVRITLVTDDKLCSSRYQGFNHDLAVRGISCSFRFLPSAVYALLTGPEIYSSAICEVIILSCGSASFWDRSKESLRLCNGFKKRSVFLLTDLF